LLPLSA